MNATEYLAQPCPHNAPDVVIRSDCWECFRDAVTELVELRAKLHRCGFARDEFHALLHEFAGAGVQYDAGKYLVVQVSREMMDEARRLTR